VFTAAATNYEYFHDLSLLLCAAHTRVVEHVLHVVQVFQHVQQLLHPRSVVADSSMVFSGRMVTSATSGFRPAASSAFFTASKSA
jgi:hypothetical protein